MHLFIATETKLPVPRSILECTIIDLVSSLGANQQLHIVLVGTLTADNLNRYCAQKKYMLSMMTKWEAAKFLKKEANAAIVHFGVHINWAQQHQVYFFPLALPEDAKNKSFLALFFIKKAFTAWLSNAHKILCYNDWTIFYIQQIDPKLMDKIVNIQFPIAPDVPLQWDQLAAIKAQIAKGNNYFLCFTSLEKVIPILKEFSIFKKWQHSTMQLLLVLENKQMLTKAQEQLKGYKFKEDVVLQNLEEVCNEWIAASYAILWEGNTFSTTYWFTNIIRYEIPILFDIKTKLPAGWGKAGEVFSFSTQLALSNHLKLYYKDELYRHERALAAKDWLVGMLSATDHSPLFNNIVFSHIK